MGSGQIMPELFSFCIVLEINMSSLNWLFWTFLSYLGIEGWMNFWTLVGPTARLLCKQKWWKLVNLIWFAHFFCWSQLSWSTRFQGGGSKMNLYNQAWHYQDFESFRSFYPSQWDKKGWRNCFKVFSMWIIVWIQYKLEYLWDKEAWRNCFRMSSMLINV